MATIGQLAVNLICRTDKFSSGIGKARKDLKAFSGAASFAQRHIVALGATLVGAFAVSKLRAQADGLDRLAKSADRLGVSFEFLQRARIAGQLEEIDEATLVRGLTEMQKRLEQGHKGFKQLGLEIQKLKKMKGEEVFLKIADAIAKMPAGKSRIAGATGVFGKAGTSMLGLLSGGSAAIDSATADMSVFSRADAEKIDAMNDEITKTTQAFESLQRELVLYNSEFVKWGAQFLSDSARGARQTFTGMTSADLLNRELTDKKINGMSRSEFQEYTWKNRAPGAMDQWEQAAAANRVRRDMAQDQDNRRQSYRTVANAPSRFLTGGFDKTFKLAGDGIDALGRMGESVRKFERGTMLAAAKSGFGFGPFQGGGRSERPGLTAAMGIGLSNEELAARARSITAIGGPGAETRGNAALERGTAAAASQARRSAQQNKLVDLAKQQLKAQKDTLKAIKEMKGQDLGATLLVGEVV